MNKVKIVLVTVAILILIGFVATAIAYPFFGRTSPPDVGQQDPNGPGDPNGNGSTNPDPGDPTNGTDPEQQPDPDPEPEPEPEADVIPRPEHVRGLYLTGWGAGTASLRDPVLDLVRQTGLNSLVINVKDDEGYITYRDTQVELALEAGANVNQVDMRQFLEHLDEKQIYPIARVVVAKDKFISEIMPQWFLQDKDGSVWHGKGSVPWADMRNEDYWDYLIDISIEAAEMGFREIQFDYVRWPSGGDGPISRIADLPEANLTSEGSYELSEAVADFMTYAMDQLEPYNVEVSADTFGIMGTTQNEQSVGQHLETLLESEMDVICPMIYPSHYWEGSYGQDNPNRAPYEVVYQSTLDHLERMEAMGSETVLRPWLQDFNHWDDPGYEYGPDQIQAQIEALEDLGVNEFLFWNAGNKYTEEGYRGWDWE